LRLVRKSIPMRAVPIQVTQTSCVRFDYVDSGRRVKDRERRSRHHR
jgi:hypothetical protein